VHSFREVVHADVEAFEVAFNDALEAFGKRCVMKGAELLVHDC
jgi:hypothetical protein